MARLLADNVYSVFASNEYNCGVVTKTDLLRIPNTRFNYFSRAFGILPDPFRASADGRDANMTGKHRRNQVPFYWPALNGLRPNINPDDDDLLQASLLLDMWQRRWRGVNASGSHASRSTEQIGAISKVAFAGGVLLAQCIRSDISTKLHRLIHHTDTHLYLHGCARRGDTDLNEAMHRDVKTRYNATNKHASELGMQVAKLYYEPSPDESPDTDMASYSLNHGLAHGADVTSLIADVQDIADTVSVSHLCEAIQSMCRQYSTHVLWRRFKQCTIQVPPEWDTNAQVQFQITRATVHGTDSHRNGQARYDAVLLQAQLRAILRHSIRSLSCTSPW